MLAIKPSLIALVSLALLAQAAPTSDVAYETEDGRLEYFQVEDEEELYDPETTDVAYETTDGRPESFQVEDEKRSFTPGYLDGAYETEDGRLDYFQVLDQSEELDSCVRRGEKALFGWKLRNDGELARWPE